MKKINFVTLGCSKNEVDTSIMNSILDTKKYKATNNPIDADVIVVNTCGFIDSAKEESIDTILEACQMKKNSDKKVLLAGCLAQRYKDELLENIPEIDGIIGTGNINLINEALDDLYKDQRPVFTGNLHVEYTEGAYKDPKEVKVTEYVKISEGCNNFCTYCIIPKLRGKNRSRKIENIYKEVEYLVENGTREIILIAQNTTDYGIDLYNAYKLTNLIKEISKIKELKWIRVLYLYPDNFKEDLIEEFKNNKKLVKYADIPLQHISNRILKLMNRRTNQEDIESLIKKLRNRIPGMVIRTTFIVGFPSETDEDFEILKSFIEESKFDKVGVFTYSREEGTPAYSMKNQVDEEIKRKRLEEIMEIQADISANSLSEKVGEVFEVLVEEKIDETTYSGRTYMDAPEIDGVTYISSDKELNINSFVDVKITDSIEYDLIGECYESTK